MDKVIASLSSRLQSGSCCCYVKSSEVPAVGKTDGNDRDDRGNLQPTEIKILRKGD